MMRIRQIVFAVRDLAHGRARLASLLGLDPPFRDPDVAVFGIDNAVYVFGDQFVELISPIQEGTAAGRALDRRGDWRLHAAACRPTTSSASVRASRRWACGRCGRRSSPTSARCICIRRTSAARSSRSISRSRRRAGAGADPAGDRSGACRRPASGRRHVAAHDPQRDGRALGRGARTRSATRGRRRPSAGPRRRPGRLRRHRRSRGRHRRPSRSRSSIRPWWSRRRAGSVFRCTATPSMRSEHS